MIETVLPIHTARKEEEEEDDHGTDRGANCSAYVGRVNHGNAGMTTRYTKQQPAVIRSGRITTHRIALDTDPDSDSPRVWRAFLPISGDFSGAFPVHILKVVNEIQPKKRSLYICLQQNWISGAFSGNFLYY